MTTYRSLAALLCVATLSACKMFDENTVKDITGPVPSGALIRFFNFGVGAPGVNFWANDAKVTAISSATGSEATTGVAPGGVGNAGLYSSLAAGQYTLTGKIAAAATSPDKDVAIATVSTSLAQGKAYSYFVSGIYSTTTKTADAFVVEDPFIPQFDYAVAYVRFVNAISNANPMALYAKNTTSGAEVAIGGEVAYKTGTAFVSVPNGVYDLNTRYAGSATNVISRTQVNFVAGRIYTVGARGDITVTSSTSANRPQLDNTANR